MCVPVCNCPVAFDLLRCQVTALDVEACVVREVTEGHFVESFSEEVRLVPRQVVLLRVVDLVHCGLSTFPNHIESFQTRLVNAESCGTYGVLAHLLVLMMALVQLAMIVCEDLLTLVSGKLGRWIFHLLELGRNLLDSTYNRFLRL